MEDGPPTQAQRANDQGTMSNSDLQKSSSSGPLPSTVQGIAHSPSNYLTSAISAVSLVFNFSLKRARSNCDEEALKVLNAARRVKTIPAKDHENSEKSTKLSSGVSGAHDDNSVTRTISGSIHHGEGYPGISGISYNGTCEVIKWPNNNSATVVKKAALEVDKELETTSHSQLIKGFQANKAALDPEQVEDGKVVMSIKKPIHEHEASTIPDDSTDLQPWEDGKSHEGMESSFAAKNKRARSPESTMLAEKRIAKRLMTGESMFEIPGLAIPASSRYDENRDRRTANLVKADGVNFTGNAGASTKVALSISQHFDKAFGNNSKCAKTKPRTKFPYESLPTEIHEMIFGQLHPITSVCLGLTSKYLYSLHLKLHPKPVHLLTRPSKNEPKVGYLRDLLTDWMSPMKFRWGKFYSDSAFENHKTELARIRLERWHEREAKRKVKREKRKEKRKVARVERHATGQVARRGQTLGEDA